MKECVNMLLYWMYVIQLNAPQRYACQKKKKKKKKKKKNCTCVDAREGEAEG